MKATRVFYEGFVQGVGFRWTTKYLAKGYDVSGWVRNRRDGTVEAVFAGSADDVRAMIEDCRQGPPGSRIDAIEERDGSRRVPNQSLLDVRLQKTFKLGESVKFQIFGDALNLLNVDSYWQRVAVGVVIIAAAAAERLRSDRSR